MNTPSGSLREYAAATTRGLSRSRNEDAVAIGGALLTGEVIEPVRGRVGSDAIELFAVADGVSGQVCGARASREVVASLLADPPTEACPDACIDAVRRANLYLHGVMLQHPETVGMGTTVAGLLVQDASACWFNVGDSRVYCMHAAHTLEQLSIDDVVESQELGVHPHRRSHALSHSLGGQRAISPIQPHAGYVATAPGKRLLLCSDGLTDMLPDNTIATVLASHHGAVAAVRTLLTLALNAGGKDNISILIVQ